MKKNEEKNSTKIINLNNSIIKINLLIPCDNEYVSWTFA